MGSKSRVVFYADVDTWAQLRDIAPGGQLSRFVRFILSDAVTKIESGDYQKQLEEYANQNFRVAFINKEDSNE